MKKRVFSFLMAIAMVLSILPMPVLAAEECTDHPEHDETCGYAAVEGTPCSHQHSAACRVETVSCTHTHTAECYSNGDMEGDPTCCSHFCSVESGCVKVSCSHIHDEECGYVEAAAGQPCGHACEACNPPSCTCDVKCNAMVNHDCPVCGCDPNGCQGKAPEERVAGQEGPMAVTAWTWVDPEEYLEDGDLALPGACAGNPASFETVVSMLPAAIIAVTADGKISLPLAWACPGYPEGGAYEGEYTFTATLPEGCALVEGAAALNVKMTLGGGETFDIDIFLHPNAVTLMTGDTYDLRLDIFPSDAICSNLTCTSSDDSVVTAVMESEDENLSGRIILTAVAAGSAVITVHADNVTTACVVTVMERPANAASVNGQNYPSLFEAVNAAAPGDTVTLLNDWVQNEDIYIDKNLTLDLNEHILIVQRSYGIQVKSGSALTVKTGTNGNIISGNYYYTIRCFGELKVEGHGISSRFVVDGGTILGGTFHDIVVLQNNATIADGFFNSDVNVYSGSVVTGGSFKNSPSGIASGYRATKAGDYYVVVPRDAIAMVGGTGYATLAAAANAAKPGETITLLDNIVVDSKVTFTKDYTLDLSTFTITVDEPYAFYVETGKLTIKAESGDILNSASAGFAMQIDGTMEVQGDLSCRIYLNGEITGGTYYGNVLGNGAMGGNLAGKISGGTFLGGANYLESITDGTFENSVFRIGSISGGTFGGGVFDIDSISGGTFGGYVNDIGSISGGFFKDDPSRREGCTLADGCIAVPSGNADYPWMVAAIVGPFLISGGTGYRWDDAAKLLFISESGLAVANTDPATPAYAQIFVEASCTSLILNGVNIFHQWDALSVNSSFDLTLKGENSLKSESAGGIVAHGALTIGGSGRVDLEGEFGIDGSSTVSITGGTVNAKGNMMGIRSDGALSISGGRVDISSNFNGIHSSDTVSISGGIVTTMSNRIGIYGASGIFITGGAGTAIGYSRAMSIAPTLDDVVATGVYTDLVMSWAPVDYTLTVTAPTFDAVNPGYAQPDAKTITITSVGNSEAMIANVTVDAPFEIDSGDIVIVPAGGTNTNYTLQPKAGLDVGEYKATITVTYKKNAGAPDIEDQTATAEVAFTVAREPVDYLDAEGKTQTCTDYTPVTNGMTTWGVAGETTWYVVDGNVTISGRINTVGDVHLILKDSCKLDAKQGITVAEGNKFTVYGQPTGESVGMLSATGGSHQAGIGGEGNVSAGEITINGGAVSATGGNAGSGIGGGRLSSDGKITINGGKVIATGGYFGAGIGGGYGDSGLEIIIKGGTVEATGGEDGAGIGGGEDGSGCKITIEGGTVKATGISGGAGIGGGWYGPSGEIIINGGNVTASSSEYGPGIGSGRGGRGGAITISGGTVEASGGYSGSGIGGGLAGSIDTITISGGTVKAARGEDSDNDIVDGYLGLPATYIYIHREANLVNKSGSFPTVGSVVDGGTRIIETKTLTMTNTALTKAYGAAPFTPNLAAYPSITTEKPLWSSSDTSVAEVDENGVVTVKGIGEAKITASVTDTDADPKIVISATCVLTVTKSAAAITVTADKTEYTYGDTITLTAVVSATGTAPAARARTAPTANQMAVFLNAVQVSDPADVVNGQCALTVSTKDLGADTHDLTVKFLGSTNLHEAEADVEVLVKPKQLTPSVVGTTSKVYDGTTETNGTTGMVVLDGAVFGDLPTAAGTFAFADANAGENKTVNVTAITLDAAWAQNYALSTQSLTTAGTITPRPLTVTADAGYKTYGGNDPALTYMVRNLVTGDPLTGALARAPGENAGTYEINQGTLSAGSNYTMTFTGAVFTIGKAYPHVTIPADRTATYGDILENVALPEGWTWDNSTASVGNAGDHSFEVTFTPGDTANYNTVHAAVTVTVNKAALTVTAEAKTKVYGQDDPELTYTVSGFCAGDGLTLMTGELARIPGENVGAYAIDQGSLSAGNNYTINFTKANLTITPKTLTVTAGAKTKVYGQDDPELTYTVSGFALDDTDAVMTGELARIPGENVGAYAIDQGSLSAGNNYTINFTKANLTITPKTLTVTAGAKTKVYGQDDPELTYTVSGFALDDTDAVMTGELARIPGENVGTYAIEKGSLSAGGNYTVNFTGADFTITKADPAVTVPTGLTATYGDILEDVSLPAGWAWDDSTASVGTAGDHSFEVTFTPGDTANYNTVHAAVTVTVGKADPTVTVPTGLTATYGDTLADVALPEGWAWDDGTDTAAGNAGSNVFSATFTPEDTDNYNTVTENLTVDVAPKAVTVIAESKTKVYGDMDPELTYKANVEGVPFIGTLARKPGENAGGYDITQGTLTAGGNYAITFVGAELTIDKKALKIAAVNGSKVYGEADPELTWKVEGLVGEDEITVTLSRAEGEDAGKYVITGTVDAGGNYNVTFTAASFEITPKPVTVTAETKSKVYGSEDPQLSYTADVENVPFIGELSRTQGENVGEYLITQGTLSAGDNYALTFVGAKLTIAPKSMTITVDSKTKAYGEADPELTYTMEGLAAGDEGKITVDLTRVPGENVGSYIIHCAINDQTGNYEIHYLEGTFTITKASLAEAEISVVPDLFTYDGTGHQPAVTVKLDGRELIPDTDYTIAYSGNVNAGIATVTVTGKDNYSGTAGAEFTIEKALPTVDLPTLVPVTYGEELSEIELPAGWSWADERIIPTVQNQGFLAYFTADEINYDWADVEGYDAENHWVSRTLALTVNKADPEPIIPTDLTASTGRTLADVQLPAGWEWNAPGTAVNETGEQKFPATFTPDDTDNYNTLTAELTVMVGEHLVKFDSEGGSSVPTQVVKDGEKAVKPTDPTRDGCAFKGWYKDKDLKEKWNFNTDRVTETMILHAKWAKVYAYTLSYDANAGEAAATGMPAAETKESEGSTISFQAPLTEPKRSGYTFSGWNTQANGKGTKVKARETIELNGDLTLYAQWKQNSGSWWDTPKTGDYTMGAVAMLVVSCAVSGTALAGLLVYGKKKKK